MARPVFRRLRLDQLNLPRPGIRTDRRKLAELAASIEAVGILVPLIVRAIGGGEYAVIGGAGRLEALQRNGARVSTKVPCVVVDVDDAEATLLALVDNIVREDMRPYDEAETARVLVEDYAYTQERVAKALGKNQASVSRWLAVFALDKSVIAALRKGTIEMRTALALLPLRDDKPAQRAILAKLIAKGWSAGVVSGLVAAKMHAGAMAPLRYALDGAGRVDAKTTRSGKLRVVLTADDRAGLMKLARSLQKKLNM